MGGADNPECAENDDRSSQAKQGAGDKKGGFDSGENACEHGKNCFFELAYKI